MKRELYRDESGRFISKVEYDRRKTFNLPIYITNNKKLKNINERKVTWITGENAPDIYKPKYKPHRPTVMEFSKKAERNLGLSKQQQQNLHDLFSMANDVVNQANKSIGKFLPKIGQNISNLDNLRLAERIKAAYSILNIQDYDLKEAPNIKWEKFYGMEIKESDVRKYIEDNLYDDVEVAVGNINAFRGYIEDKRINEMQDKLLSTPMEKLVNQLAKYGREDFSYTFYQLGEEGNYDKIKSEFDYMEYILNQL